MTYYYIICETLTHETTVPHLNLPSNQWRNLAVTTNLKKAYEQAASYFHQIRLNEHNGDYYQATSYSLTAVRQQLKDENLATVAKEAIIVVVPSDPSIATTMTTSLVIQSIPKDVYLV